MHLHLVTLAHLLCVPWVNWGDRKRRRRGQRWGRRGDAQPASSNLQVPKGHESNSKNKVEGLCDVATGNVCSTLECWFHWGSDDTFDSHKSCVYFNQIFPTFSKTSPVPFQIFVDFFQSQYKRGCRCCCDFRGDCSKGLSALKVQSFYSVYASQALKWNDFFLF